MCNFGTSARTAIASRMPFVCGGGDGVGLHGTGTYMLARSPSSAMAIAIATSFHFAETTMTMSGTTYGYCTDANVYTYELTFEPPATFGPGSNTMPE